MTHFAGESNTRNNL